MLARRLVRSLLVALPIGVLSGSCTSSVDVKHALELTDVSGGWFDAGIKDGKNKIVPSVTFRLRKKTDVDLEGVSLNVVFRHPAAPGGNTEDEWGEVFLQNAQFTEGSRTAPLTVRTENGYTGDPPQSRLDLLKNSQFRDVRARVFAKYSSTQWVEIGTIDVPRQLITR
ncbi:MAG: hypothetical protein ACRD15_19685 [Vicinamibacterales bacterium]